MCWASQCGSVWGLTFLYAASLWSVQTQATSSLLGHRGELWTLLATRWFKRTKSSYWYHSRLSHCHGLRDREETVKSFQLAELSVIQWFNHIKKKGIKKSQTWYWSWKSSYSQAVNDMSENSLQSNVPHFGLQQQKHDLSVLCFVAFDWLIQWHEGDVWQADKYDILAFIPAG